MPRKRVLVFTPPFCPICKSKNFYKNGACMTCTMRAKRETLKERRDEGGFSLVAKEDVKYVRDESFKKRFAKTMAGVWYG